MKPRILTLVALAGIVASVWLLMKPDVHRPSSGGSEVTPSSHPIVSAATSATVAGAEAKAKPATTGSAAIPVNWDRIADMIAGRAKSKAPVTDANIADFLRKRGETAINLLAVWESTEDRRWLDRGLELHPNDPALLLAAVGATPAPDNLAELIQRLKAAAPDNPLPWVYDARRLFGEKLSSEAVAELRTALGKPGFYIYASERILAARQLYMDAGLDPLSAEFLASAQIQLPHLQAARETVRQMKDATDFENATAENRAETIRLTYEMGRTFATPEASRTLIGQLVGVAIEKNALALAQSQQSNPLPVDPAARIAELERFRIGVHELTSLSEKMMAKNDAALFAEYMRRFRTEGEAAALKWVGEQVR